MRLETEKDLRKFISNKIPEGRDLDYKREPWPKDQNEEIAKDISAFANSKGGIIIVGVEEDPLTKQPVCLTPFVVEHNCRERIDQVAHDFIEPPVDKLEIKQIASKKPSKSYLVIEIPESPKAPHMNKYDYVHYKRLNYTTSRMGAYEIREVLLKTIFNITSDPLIILLMQRLTNPLQSGGNHE